MENGLATFAAAVKNGDITQVRDLMKRHPDLVNAVLDTSGETPLHLAVSARSLAMVELLLSAGADINAMSALDNTPLDYAYMHRYPEIAEFLVAHGGESYG